MVKTDFFVAGVPLPPGLQVTPIESALNETHKVIRLINTTLKRASGRPLSAYIQGNNFSGIVSNILCDSFSRFTPYQHNHEQRYPDLVYKIQNNQISELAMKKKWEKGIVLNLFR